MKKRISVDQLQLGMRIQELDRPWFDTPVGVQAFELTEAGQIDTLRRYCSFVYVAAPDRPDYTQATATVSAETELRMLRTHGRRQRDRGPVPPLASLGPELLAAANPYHSGKALVARTLEAARQGRQLNVDEIRDITTVFMQSAARHPDGLLWQLALDADRGLIAHSLRCGVLAVLLGHALELHEDDVNDLGVAALLHDIGVTRLPASQCDDEELAGCCHDNGHHRHTSYGVSILARMPGIPAAAVEMARDHHGHAEVARGDTGAPPVSRIGQIGVMLNAFDCETYGARAATAAPAYIALRRLSDRCPQRFAPELFEALLYAVGFYPAGTPVQLDSGELAVVVGVNRHRPLHPVVVAVSDTNGKPIAGFRTADLARTTHTSPSREIANVLSALPFPVDLRSVLSTLHEPSRSGDGLLKTGF